MVSEVLSVKWNGHRNTFFEVLATAREKKTFCDATIACEGNLYPVHRFVISTCSTYFEKILEDISDTHPVIVLVDIKSKAIEDLLQYMYTGEIRVLQEDIDSLIKAGEVLKIKGIGVADEKEKCKKQKRLFNDSEERPEKRRRSDEFSDSSRLNESSRESKNNKEANSSSESCNEDINQKEIDGSLSPSDQLISEFTAVKEEIFQPNEDSSHFPEQNIKVELNESLMDEEDIPSADIDKEQNQQLRAFKQAYGSDAQVHQVVDSSYQVGHSSASSNSSTTHQTMNHQEQVNVPSKITMSEVILKYNSIKTQQKLHRQQQQQHPRGQQKVQLQSQVQPKVQQQHTRVVSPDNLYPRTLQSQNTKERPYKCDQCTASFIDPAELSEHKKEHSGDGPFTCQECHVTFVYKSHFRSHKTRCSKNIYEKIYFGRIVNPKPSQH